MKHFYLQRRIVQFAVFLTVLGTLITQAQTVPTPTQTGTIITDPNGNGKAEPGDRIRYKVTIQNTGGANANGVQLNAAPDPKTTLVSGSFRTSPLAVNDTYASTGNVGLNVSAANGLKINDFDDNVAGLTITAGTFTTVQNGSITIAADGGFTYTPPAGFTGTDTYTYILNDGNGVGGGVPATDNGTVTFNISNLIWFVDNTGGGSGGNGTLTTPFKTIADFNASSGPQAGHIIFIKHTGTNYTGNMTLKANQVLYGTGHTGGANLADTGVLPFTVAPNSPALPAINGSRPVISAASDVVITLANGNTVRGIATNAGANGIAGSAIAGLTLTETTLSAATAEGLKLTNPTGTLAITANTFSAAGNGVTATFNGTAGLDFSNNSLTSSGGTGASINGTGGTLTITGFAANTVDGNTTGDGINITAARFDATAGGAYQTVTGGATVIGTSGNKVGGSGLVLANVTGDLSFTDLDIYTTNGTGLFASGSGIFNASGTGFRVVTTAGAATIDAAGGPAVNLTDATVDLQLASLTSTGSTSTGLSLTTVAGTFSAPSGSTITNAAGTDVNISGGTANVTYNGTITDDVGQLISVSGATGGTKSFTGAITDGNDGDGSGISLSSNTGATIDFSGGLTLSTGTNAAFSATGGGTLTVTGANNTITTTTGTALNVTNTTIGASGLTFKSVAANGASNGIVLNTTGTSGGLSITGTGTTDGSGGTIQNITNRGISVTSSSNLSLKNMTFTNANITDASPCGATDNSGCNAAIHLNGVTGAIIDNITITTTAQNGINVRETGDLSISNCFVTQTGAGGQSEEGGLYALNLFGTSSITNSQFTFPAVRGGVIYNTNKTLTMTITNSEFSDTQSSAVGADGFEMTSFGTSNTTMTVTNCTFMRDKTNGIQFLTENNALGNITMTGCTVDPGIGIGVPLDFASNGTSTLKYKILNNTALKGRATSLVNLFAQGNSTMEGRVNNNAVQSLSGSGSGIRVIAQDNTTKHTVEILNNTVSGISNDNGIIVQARGVAGETPRIDATIMGNNTTIATTASYGIAVIAGASNDGSNSTVCARVANNSALPAPSNGAPIGTAQLRAGTPAATLHLQGPGSSVQNYWDSNGNSPTTGNMPPAVISGPGVMGATVTINQQTCATPSN